MDAGPLPTDQCTNAADMAIVDAVRMIDAGPMMTQTPGDYILDCLDTPGQDCYPLIFDDGATDQDMADCIDECISTTLTAGLSDGCLLCYSPAASCAAENCAVECLGSTCYECMEEHGCIAALEDCTGLAIP